MRIALIALAIPLLWFALAIPGALIPGQTAPTATGPRTETILVASSAVHADILLPATPEIRARFAFAEGAGVPISWNRVTWIAVGWGGLDFYTTTPTWSDLSLRATLKGIFGDDGVIRIDVYGPLGPHPGLKEVHITPNELNRLTDVILADLTRDPSGAPIVHDSPGFTTTDRFFHGQDRFNALYTCNAWVGETLRAAGLRLGAWTPTPYALNLSLARYGHLDHDI